jgi:hypothetical protein
MPGSYHNSADILEGMKRQVAIIGTGWVGASVAISTLHSGVVDELLLHDARADVAEGEAMDLAHGASFTRPPPSGRRRSTRLPPPISSSSQRGAAASPVSPGSTCSVTTPR